MRLTPRKAGRMPAPGTRFLSDMIGANIRDYRTIGRLSQEQLAEGMRVQGHNDWSRATVGEVEAARRNLTVEELFALAAAMSVPIAALLEPAGVAGRNTKAIDYGGEVPLTPRAFRHWWAGDVIFGLDQSVPGVFAPGNYSASSIPGKEVAFEEFTADLTEMQAKAVQTKATRKRAR